jgi:hypothetical protein
MLSMSPFSATDLQIELGPSPTRAPVRQFVSRSRSLLDDLVGEVARI